MVFIGIKSNKIISFSNQSSPLWFPALQKSKGKQYYYSPPTTILLKIIRMFLSSLGLKYTLVCIVWLKVVNTSQKHLKVIIWIFETPRVILPQHSHHYDKIISPLFLFWYIVCLILIRVWTETSWCSSG